MSTHCRVSNAGLRSRFSQSPPARVSTCHEFAFLVSFSSRPDVLNATLTRPKHGVTYASFVPPTARPSSPRSVSLSTTTKSARNGKNAVGRRPGSFTARLTTLPIRRKPPCTCIHTHTYVPRAKPISSTTAETY